jgi:hypothetical protein
MQFWKLVDNQAQTDSRLFGDDDSNVASIADRGFASFSHPKLKFNFTMDIAWRDDVSDLDVAQGSDKMDTLDIPVKTATRPSPTINYTEVNLYNYRTKVATNVDYGTVSVTMYDDADNKAHGMYQRYLNLISPVSTATAQALLDDPQSVPFGKMSSITTTNNRNGLLRKIRIHHFYVNTGVLLRTTYTYINPKVVNFELDELSMSESETNTVTLTFNYDGVTIEKQPVD